MLAKRLEDKGVHVTKTNGNLKVRVRGQLTDKQRAFIRSHKAELIEELTPRRRWLIRHADGRLISHSFTPSASRAEVESWYPDAKTIRPESAEEAAEYRAMTTTPTTAEATT